MIVIIGSVNMDLVLCVLCMFLLGEILVGDKFMIIFGGKGVNQVVVCVCLVVFGILVVMVVCVGDDVFGGQMCQLIIVCGIDDCYIDEVVGEVIGIVFIMVDVNVQNSIVIVVGVNGCLDVECIECVCFLIEQVFIVLL